MHEHVSVPRRTHSSEYRRAQRMSETPHPVRPAQCVVGNHSSLFVVIFFLFIQIHLNEDGRPRFGTSDKMCFSEMVVGSNNIYNEKKRSSWFVCSGGLN